MKIIKILLLFLSINSYGQILKVSLKDLGLKGKVKTVKRKVFRDLKVDDKVNDELIHNTFLTHFNRSGLTVSVENNIDLKKLKVEGECEYDERNRVTLLKTKWRQKVYNNRRNKLKTVKYRFEDHVVYNPAGNMAILDKVKNDELFTRKIFRLNSRNKVTEATVVSPDKNTDKKSKEEYKYNPQGQLIEKTEFNFFTKEYVSKKYKYDEKGNCVEEWVTLPNDQFMKIRKKYNDNNDVIEEMAEYNGRMLINRSTYTYDKYNNFIRKEEITNDFKKIVTIREITYYE